MNNSLNLNSSFVNMSREDLVNEVINLKRINSVQTQKIDDHEQKLYELKRQLLTSKAMEEHLTCEIDLLQKNNKSENDELLKKMSGLEDEIHTLKQTNTENIQSYEKILQTKNTEIETIIENTKASSEINKGTSREEIHKFTDEICDLKFQLETQVEQFYNCETNYEEVSLKNSSLTNKITELSSQIQELRNCLKAKKEELEENKELVRNLQDEKIVMQMEIDKFISLPMEKAAKGNSLFAEVDDNRVKLQKTMETMKKKYMDVRTQYTSKCHELQKLHMEYASLIKVIENKNDSSEEKSELIQTYERHFERLNENVKSLQNEIDVQKHAFTKLISKDWKCAQEMIAITRGEVQTLQRKLNAESLGLITSESNHYKTKRELKKWQAEAMQLRAQILSLNQTIDDLKETTNVPVPSFTQIVFDVAEEKSMDYSVIHRQDDSQLKDFNADYSIFDELKPACKDIKKKYDSKENITDNIQNNTMDNLTAQMRKVSFEKNTVEPQRTGKLGGRKIITANAVHIPSIRRN